MSCLCFFLTSSFFFFKQKTAYEMRTSDWSSDVCSSDLPTVAQAEFRLDRFGKDGDEGTVYRAEHVDEREHAEHVIPIGRRAWSVFVVRCLLLHSVASLSV